MGDRTGIEWTDATWNPVVGCSKVSPGCDNYAIAMSRPIEATGNEAYQGLTTSDDWTGSVKCLPERLDQPLRWQRPRRVFVNSMSDLFHPDVPDGFIADVWTVMESADQHIFQVLTKRPQKMAALLNDPSWWEMVVGPHDDGEPAEPLPMRNIWLGTSIESDRYTFRANHLRATPAAVRFLSLEPLLGPLPSLNLTGIDWVIVGGESGPGARPMHIEWVRDIRDRCISADVPFFFKQWGAWAPRLVIGRESGYVTFNGELHNLYSARGIGADDPKAVSRVGKKAAGRTLDGRTWDEMPAEVLR